MAQRPYDLVLRGGTLVTPTELLRADLAVAGGRIAAIEPEVMEASREALDATGLYVLPALIDAHVHFNEPGRTHWEGIASGSRAIAAGGGATFFDMPLNAHPPTVDAAAFDAKLASAQASSVVDFALWGGLVPGNLDQMEALAARGVIGFKAFMSSTGVDDFAAADDLTLYEGMARAAALGLPVAVHAENDAITGLLARRAVAQGRTTARDYLASRPVIAELEAIARAILLARETGCALHIVHVSTGRGVELVAEARRQGVDVTCETCPHYLLFDEDDLERAFSNSPLLGALAKCAPPLRPRAEQEALWEHLRTGALPMIASDHSPAPADRKAPSAKGADFFQIWGGISGCQSTLPLLLDAGHLHRGLPLTTIARTCATFPAERFGLASPEPAAPSDSPPPLGPQLKVSDPQGSWAQRKVGDLQGECNTTQGEVPPRGVQDERSRLWRGKGRLAAGADADLALIDLRGEDTITADRLFYRHRHSPYLGRTVRGRVVRTLVRGTTVFLDGRIVAPPAGRLVRPTKA